MDDLQRHLDTILRWKRVVIAAAIIGALVAGGLAFLRGGPDWEASATVVAGTSQRSPEQDAPVARFYAQQINGTLQETLRTAAATPDDVIVSAESVAGGPFVTITVAAASSEEAVAAVAALTDAFVQHIRTTNDTALDEALSPLRASLQELNRQINVDQRQIDDDAAGRINLSAANRAAVQARLDRLRPEAQGVAEQLRERAARSSGINPVASFGVDETATRQGSSVLSNAVLGLIGGALLGSLLALFLNALELRLSTPGQVKRRLGLDTLAVVPAGDPARRIEAYQALANRLALTEQARRTVSVTSPTVEDGKSAVARNLARYRAELGDQVVLIDATFSGGGRNGTSPEGDGLAELLRDTDGSVDIAKTLVQSNVENLRLLPAGAMPRDPYSLFSGDRMSKVLEEASLHADLVVIDAPPVLQSAESQVICSLADGALLVLDSGSTSTSRASAAHEELSRVRATVLGVVLRDTERGRIRLRP